MVNSDLVKIWSRKTWYVLTLTKRQMMAHKDPQTLFTGIDQQNAASSWCLCDQVGFQWQNKLSHAASVYPCRYLLWMYVLVW